MLDFSSYRLLILLVVPLSSCSDWVASLAQMYVWFEGSVCVGRSGCRVCSLHSLLLLVLVDLESSQKMSSSNAQAGPANPPGGLSSAASAVPAYRVAEGFLTQQEDQPKDMAGIMEDFNDYRKKGKRKAEAADRLQNKLDYILGRTETYESGGEEDDEDETDDGEDSQKNKKKKGPGKRLAKKAVVPIKEVRPGAGCWWRWKSYKEMKKAVKDNVDELNELAATPGASA